MELALKEAHAAAGRGETPVGAVVVREGVVIAAAGNRVREDDDPTGHAEILAIRQACAALGQSRLDGADLYVTLEPCAMCAGAIAHARIAESEATRRAIDLASLTDTPMLIVHVSDEAATSAIRSAQTAGLKIFGETCPQYLFLTAADLDRDGLEGAKYCCSPPPRDSARIIPGQSRGDG